MAHDTKTSLDQIATDELLGRLSHAQAHQAHDANALSYASAAYRWLLQDRADAAERMVANLTREQALAAWHAAETLQRALKEHYTRLGDVS
jgi:hypothetical protein